MKITDKDIRFAIYTAVFSLVVMALMHIAVPQPPMRPAADPVLVQKVMSRIVPISTLQLREKIAGDRPTFIFIYTSWCPYCRQIMPNVVSLKEKGIMKNARVLFISLDKKKKELAEYIAAEGYHDAYLPYIFRVKENRLLVEMLQAKGSRFVGGIPYGALFNKHGELIAETDEKGNWEGLFDALNELNK